MPLLVIEQPVNHVEPMCAAFRSFASSFANVESSVIGFRKVTSTFSQHL